MPFYDNEPDSIHLELSELCNADCPMCGRNRKGSKNPNLIDASLHLDSIKKIFPPYFVLRLKRIQLCGNFGDPLATNDLIPILQYFRGLVPDVMLMIHTNASLRSVTWWEEFGQLCSLPKDRVKFSIDGLRDTNHIYRRNTDFDTIIRNAKAFIKAGGRADWEFLVFHHNEHQVDEARAMATDMGFQQFWVKRTNRFFDYKTNKTSSSYEVLDKNGQVEYSLYPPDNAVYKNPATELDLIKISQQNGGFQHYLDTTNISCKWKSKKSVYISARGHVYPCCWMAAEPFYNVGEMISHLDAQNQVQKLLLQAGGFDAIDARLHTIDEIIAGEFFRLVKESWQQPSIAEGRLKLCAKWCGKGFDSNKETYMDEFGRASLVKDKTQI